MKILFANKYYFLKGGAERYMFELRALLTKHWHTVVPFAMDDRRNMPTEWKRYFVSNVETENVSFSLGGLKTAGRMLYSFEARRKFAKLLDAAKPDLVHVHNIYHQISPSILPAAKKRGLPVVMTVHDYKLIAPNYSLFHDGAICERTKPDRWWEAVKHRCIKGSKAASMLTAFEMALHRRLGLYLDNIDAIVAPSRFVQALLVEYGIDAAKIMHVPHFIDATTWTPRYEGSYALYVGRLSEEKGVDVLIRAAAKRKDLPLRIVGTGPAEAALKALAAELGATNVMFLGFQGGDALRQAYAGARFIVVPSVWYEVFGLIVLEAYAAGKPVVASQIGGLAELVIEGETGLAASAGNVDELAEKIAALWDSPLLCAEMGRAGRAWVEEEFAPELHYSRIMQAYEKAKELAKADKK
ncbi:MAG TPA: glycosyltransferase family 4 protein [Candidatus Eisenbacteria bacterium]|nr:glycosyltransferase family 4 protein [Candidatus Eisenbacteria bacterium]